MLRLESTLNRIMSRELRYQFLTLLQTTKSKVEDFRLLLYFLLWPLIFLLNFLHHIPIHSLCLQSFELFGLLANQILLILQWIVMGSTYHTTQDCISICECSCLIINTMINLSQIQECWGMTQYHISLLLKLSVQHLKYQFTQSYNKWWMHKGNALEYSLNHHEYAILSWNYHESDYQSNWKLHQLIIHFTAN